MQDLSPVIIFRFAIRVNFRVEYSCDPRNKGRESNCSSKLNIRPMINSSRSEREREGKRQREKSEKVESSIDPFFNCYRYLA